MALTAATVTWGSGPGSPGGVTVNCAQASHAGAPRTRARSFSNSSGLFEPWDSPGRGRGRRFPGRKDLQVKALQFTGQETLGVNLGRFAAADSQLACEQLSVFLKPIWVCTCVIVILAKTSCGLLKLVCAAARSTVNRIWPRRPSDQRPAILSAAIAGAQRTSARGDQRIS
jgi:hypothetical protein